MSRSNVLDDRVWLRAARLLAAVFLLVGMVAGPLGHGVGEGSSLATVASEADRHDEPGVPDVHHLCALCGTLSSAVAATVLAAPDVPPAALPAETFPGPAMHGLAASDLTKARAPPLA